MDRETGPKRRGEDGSEDTLAAALAGARSGTDKADTYLDEATRLARLKIEQLEEERRFEPFSHFSVMMKAAFESAVALVILAILVAAGAMILSAANDTSLVIEPFSVPADMTAKGLSGQVVAAQLQDRLAALQQQTQSMRAADSYQNNWGDEIQVQIPETGVSLGELNRYLHRWLGHQTRISGEVYDDGGKLTVAARVGSEPARRFTGTNGELDALVQKAAEAVYAKTQPYRYAVYLQTANRTKEAAATYQGLIAHGPKSERSWAYVGLANLAQSRGDNAEALNDLHRAIAARPGFILAYINLRSIQSGLEHGEAAYRTLHKVVELLRAGDEPDINPQAITVNRLAEEAAQAVLDGDYRQAIRYSEQVTALPDYTGSHDGAYGDEIRYYAFAHDYAGMERATKAAATTVPRTPLGKINYIARRFIGHTVIGDWKVALAEAAELEEISKTIGRGAETFRSRTLAPLRAYALAMGGRIAQAQALVAPTPTDCDDCLRIRLRIATMAHDWKAANHWGALCAARTPSLPACLTDWADALRDEGRYGQAVAKYATAHARGPHYADALEGWGEALMLQNRSDLALAKFESADEDAPNWGRLHLKWGEALAYTGDKAGAKKQFGIAATLYLTAGEKAALAKWRRHG